MKKILSTLLCICISVSLAACQNNAGTANLPTNSPNNAPNASCPEDVISVAVPITEENLKDDDGTLIFQYMYQHMYLTIPDQAVADSVTVDFLNRVDGSRQEADNLAAQAKANYAPSASWKPYIYQTTYNPTRIDRGVLSLLGTNVSVFGGPHPERTYISANYNLVTGEVLTLGSILTHVDKKAELCNLILQRLSDLKAEKHLYNGYEDTVRMHFQNDESGNESFYFTPSGLCFYYSPYEIAPYISGMIFVEIPYAQLTGILEDAFFPEERETATGDICIEPFSQNSLSDFSQFSEVIIHSEGARILLHADAMIHNVRIDTGYWNLDGTIFIPEQTVYAAAALCQYDAIMLQYDIPDALPTLRVTFDSMGKTLSYYISQNGPDNPLILLPA